MNFRINVRAIIPYEGKLLLSKNKNLPGFWCLPGGGLEAGESLKQALAREVFEETGVSPKVGKLLFIQQIGDGTQFNYPEFFFLIMNSKDFRNIDVKRTTHALKELDALEFVDITGVPILPEFLSKRIPELLKNNFDTPVECILP